MRNWLKLFVTYDLALEIGIENALVLEYFIYEIDQKAANGLNYKDGKNWTYNTHDALLTRLPFKTRKPLMRVIKYLVDNNFLVLGKFNKFKYDRTTWYSLHEDCAKKYGIKYKDASKRWENTGEPLSETGHDQENESETHVPNGTCLCPERDVSLSETGQPIPSSSPSSSPCSRREEPTPTFKYQLEKKNIDAICKNYSCSKLDALKAYNVKREEKEGTRYKALPLFISKTISLPEFKELIETWDEITNKKEMLLKQELEANKRKKEREEKEKKDLEDFMKYNAHKYESTQLNPELCD